MKKLLVTLFIIFFFSSSNFSQIDTSDYFPLQTGNYWEYWGLDNWSTDWIKMTMESIDDTIMQNGNHYQLIRQTFFVDTLNPYSYDFYFRTNEHKVLVYTFNDSCVGSEYVMYDFNLPDSSIWAICDDYFSNHKGIEATYLFYSPPLNLEFEGKIFNWVEVNGSDTTWAPMGSPYVDLIGKGIGIINRFIWDFSSFSLYGTRINNQIYGIITSSEEEDIVADKFYLLQNYPNPFNLSTNIQYAISSRQFVTLKVYDVLGKEVATLVNEDKHAGQYESEFNIKNSRELSLPSGAYFYQLKAGDFIETKKMLMIK